MGKTDRRQCSKERDRTQMSFCRLSLAVVIGALVASFFFVELTILRGTALAEVCPGALPSDAEGLAACTDRVLWSKMNTLDTHTLWLYNRFKRDYKDDDPNTNIPGGEAMNLPAPKQNLDMKELEIGLTLANGTFHHLQVPIDDLDDFPGYTGSFPRYIVSQLLAWLRSDIFNHLSDRAETWDSEEQGALMLRIAVGSDLDQRLLVRTHDHTSDNAISRWAYAGLAAHRLECPGITGSRRDIVEGKVPVEKRDDEYCMVDMRWMHSLEVRPGFEKYGAAAFFNSERRVTKIFWSAGEKMVYPGDADWEHAKWSWRCSVLLGVTFRDHLHAVHLMAANTMTVASRQALGQDHPLRRLIKPFTYGTVGINYAATETLAIRNSLIHRATALTWDAFVTGWDFLLRHDRMVPNARVHLQLSGTDQLGADYPFGQDFLEFHSVMESFVTAYVDLYYPDDAAVLVDSELVEFGRQLAMLPGSKLPPLTSKAMLAQTLSSLFTLVTAVHNQVGNVAEYLLHPRSAGGKIRPGVEISDVQSSFQAINIALSTAAKAPMLLSNVDHLLLSAEAKQVWAGFHSELMKLSAAIRERNKDRGMYLCNTFVAEKVTISVSI